MSSAAVNVSQSGEHAPGYDRDGLQRSIVHVGVGGFHRAHLATYVHELASSGVTDWGIVGVGILPHDAGMAEALTTQLGLYTLITRGPDSEHIEVIGSIVDYVFAADDPASAVAVMADPATQIVSLTITEGGYPISDQTAEYDPDSPVAGPGTAFNLIAQALLQRRDTHGKPITVLSCDNIMSNGTAARSSTLGEAASVDPALPQWIADNIAFPNSMVDRITPSTSDADRDHLAAAHGLHDRWPVVTEPFRQWVIEDHFTGARLPLEDLDVIITDEVAPYEIVKLQLLNAGHSCLAYLAALHGHSTVDQALADDAIRTYLADFLEVEAKPVVPVVAGIDVDEYIASLIERFSNPSIGDQIARLCLDGSAKFPKFLLPTVVGQLGNGGPIERSALALAAWCRYLRGTDDHGNPIDVSDDPLLSQAQHFATAAESDPAAFLGFSEVFPASVAHDQRMIDAFVRAHELLDNKGIHGAIEAILRED